jgi:uncharacterized protein (DUF1684 family)
MILSRRHVLAASLLAPLLAGGCGGGADAPDPIQMTDAEHEAWEIALVEMRIEKNEVMADSSRTHLPLAEVADFEGLNYYFPEPALRYRVPLVPAAEPDTVTLAKAKGQQAAYVRRGTVSFTHEGRAYTLSVFGPAEASQGDYLWLPFYDATSGTETYGGGRYLDLVRNDDGTVELDFNYAYNPLCDYDHERYNCTLPPAENRLPFPVEAGEKKYREE